MDDAEARIRAALRGLPDADPRLPVGVAERGVRTRAAAAPRRPARRSLLAGVLAAAVVGTGAALARTGVVHVRVGGVPHPASAPAPAVPLALPPGAAGIAVVADGRLTLRTRSGVGIQGLRVSAADLSPNALYVAAGMGRGLAALSPVGRMAWVHHTTGRVLDVSWSPYPVWIAYVVRVPGGRRLRVIEGDGDHDRAVADGVDAVRPFWSADGLRVTFSRGAAWWTFAPATDRRPRRGGPCTAGCPFPVAPRGGDGLPPARAGSEVVARARAPRVAGQVVALLHGDSLEAWWTRPGGAGTHRLLFRQATRPGPVSVSLR